MEGTEKPKMLQEIRHELEELEGQLKKSGAEFKAVYAEKKKRMAAILRDYLHELEESGSEKLHEIRQGSKELIDLLEADYDVSYTEYEEEPKRISKAIESLEEKAKKIYGEIGAEAAKAKKLFEGTFKVDLDKFKTELDLQAAHFKGTKERAVSEFETWKSQRLAEVAELRKKLDEKKEETEDKLDKFKDELEVSFDHLKKAFKNLW